MHALPLLGDLVTEIDLLWTQIQTNPTTIKIKSYRH